MTVVVFGIDALDPELVDTDEHPQLSLERNKSIDTISSSGGQPSTHELWPTIITGLHPHDHGLLLEDGIAWGNPILRVGSSIAGYIFPDRVKTKLGAWLLNETKADAFRVPASYYEKNGISTIFDGLNAKAIGVPNYVIDENSEDREHQLRQSMGDLFKREPDSDSGHSSEDIRTFYDYCMEMIMVRTARLRCALRNRRHELVFGYTSGLDLIGHVSYDRPEIQRSAYEEVNQFVGELLADLTDDDILVLLSDHGLQNGIHTDQAMISSTEGAILDDLDDVCDIRGALEAELDGGNHMPDGRTFGGNEMYPVENSRNGEDVADHLENLGYL